MILVRMDHFVPMVIPISFGFYLFAIYGHCLLTAFFFSILFYKAFSIYGINISFGLKKCSINLIIVILVLTVVFFNHLQNRNL